MQLNFFASASGMPPKKSASQATAHEVIVLPHRGATVSDSQHRMEQSVSTGMSNEDRNLAKIYHIQELDRNMMTIDARV